MGIDFSSARNTVESGFLSGCGGCGSTAESMQVKSCQNCGRQFCECCGKDDDAPGPTIKLCPSCGGFGKDLGITQVKY